MRTLHSPEPSAHRKHARRNNRLAQVGVVLAVVSVTATVGVGTWVLGSGADAARRDEAPAPVAVVKAPQPPLSIAPPPEGKPQRASRTAPRTSQLHPSVGQRP